MTRRIYRTRLVLLDAHAIIHRAYHALPAFTGPSGEPTGALYGLVSMLLRIVADLEPDYIAACFDLPKPTVRHEAYAQYKGTRAETDEALVAQFAGARKVFEAFSIPVYEKEGFEADDLLGTIARKMKEEPDTEVIIASGDMDTLQLIDDGQVKVYTLKKGMNDTVLYDEDAVHERYGFPPKLIPDWKGLRGDPSDNIKGVPGIGEKTATELIARFGSMEDLYAALAKGDAFLLAKNVKPRVVKLLREHEEDARFSKELATIRTDAPVAFALPKKHWKETVRVDAVLALFDAYGFRSLRERAKKALAADDASAEETADATQQETIDPAQFAEAQALLWLLASDFTNPSLEDVLAYARCRTLASAHATLYTELKGTGRLAEVYEKIERPLIPVVRRMEARGVLIDPRMLAKLAKNYAAELVKIERRIYAAAGRAFNVNSPKQIAGVLFDELGLKPERHKRTSLGARSTKESELEKLRGEHKIVGDILEYRELKKLLSTYIENLPPLLDRAHRLHAEFLQTGTSTGRMASQNPNLQNIPLHSERGKAIRHAFVAPAGWTLVGLDYSQIELRLAAILSGDEKLREIFRHGRDVHQEVAAMVFGIAPEQVDADMRRRAKVINFGILYGMGANALKIQLGSTLAEAHQFLEDYFRTFKTLAEYLEKTKGFARKYGYTETLFGRRRQFPEMKSPLPYVRAQAERMAVNAPIQGTQADIIKLAMVEADRMLEEEGAREDAHLLLQVHDELVYEVRSSRLAELAQKIKTIMERALPEKDAAGVPVIVVAKAGANWGDMEPFA